MTLLATNTRGVRQGTWDRESIINALRRYAQLYGDAFTAAAFSPSTAKWRDEPQETVDRYYLGDPETGAAWPSLNAIKSHAPGGSFNAARELAGLSANTPGPRRRTAGSHRPVRDVSHAKSTRTVYVERPDEAALIARLTRERDRALRRAERAEARVPKAITKTKTKVIREKVVDERAVARERARVERVEAQLVVARRAETEARTYATRIAARLERSEASVNELRAERRDTKADVARMSDRATAAEREAAALRAEIAMRRVIVKDAPEQAIVDDAVRVAERARRETHAAELRAAKAEREYLVLAAAATGEARKLSRAEIAELNSKGPAGRAVLADALRGLSKIKNPNERYAALTAVASAAIAWRERL